MAQLISLDMYRISTKINVNHLEGKLVQQISFSKSTITLLFEGGFLSFTGGVRITDGARDIFISDVYPSNKNCDILTILENKIVSARINESRSQIDLTFEGQIQISFIGNENFETLTLRLDGEESII
jgi:ABC-type molybdate transport system ATPase subunit